MKINNLTKIYKTEYELVKALNNMTLEFPQKGLMFIVGVSGSGKSTLMNMLSGVDTPTSGEVIVGNKSLFSENKKQLFGYRNSYVGLIFQDYNLIEDINVYDNIKLPLEFLGIEDFSIIDEVIKKVDIEDIKYSKVTEISSGQMQRVAIARALVKDSAMILADEPTGNLDSKNTKIVMDLLKEISKDRLVIVITHDDDAAHEYGDRIIAIEDGTILDDTTHNQSINEYDPKLEKSTDFINPKITLGQQIRFTKGFIRNSLMRSLAIFIMLILIPVIGNILCGYAFFDISESYYIYQEKYGSNYVQTANAKSGYQVYYNNDEFMERIDMYGEENLFELFFTYIPIAEVGQEASPFYQPVIKNIVVDNTNKLTLLEGTFPELGSSSKKATIAITDYIVQSYIYYHSEDIGIGSQIAIGNVKYDIVGIIDTNYEDFLAADLNDPLVRMAFEENLTIYNAVYTSSTGHQYIHKHLEYFVEEVKYTIIPDEVGAAPYEKVGYIVVRNEIMGVPRYMGSHDYGNDPMFTTLPSNSTYCLVSRSLWEDFMELGPGKLSKIPSFSFLCFSTNKYSLGCYLRYVYKDEVPREQDRSLKIYGTVGEIILKEGRFQTYANRRNGCRILFNKDSEVYNQVIKTENIVNASFKYAKKTWDNAESSKYVMYEFLITLLVIMAVFAYIINSMTLNLEKKKIGIKYSFGISKFPIIVPYLIETILYIVTGIIFSLLIVRVIYPFVCRTLIYTSVEGLLEYEFFYISSMSVFGWDLVVYAIMSISLIIMILSICRKSPIEIIKDL